MSIDRQVLKRNSLRKDACLKHRIQIMKHICLYKAMWLLNPYHVICSKLYLIKNLPHSLIWSDFKQKLSSTPLTISLSPYFHIACLYWFIVIYLLIKQSFLILCTNPSLHSFPFSWCSHFPPLYPPPIYFLGTVRLDAESKESGIS